MNFLITFDSPRIVAQTEDYLVLYKPHGMHCAPLRQGDTDTLLYWCARDYPEVLTCHGIKPIEGGLVHRLDSDTAGLVLVARTQECLDELWIQQASGQFIKEYQALCVPNSTPLPGFPPSPFLEKPPFIIASAFRPYGPGRRSVRPVPWPLESENKKLMKQAVTDHGNAYMTTILRMEEEDPHMTFTVRLSRGFRHQIRCHMAWLGLPVAQDMLYGAPRIQGLQFGLSAVTISFVNPRTKEKVSYGLGLQDKRIR